MIDTEGKEFLPNAQELYLRDIIRNIIKKSIKLLKLRPDVNNLGGDYRKMQKVDHKTKMHLTKNILLKYLLDGSFRRHIIHYIGMLF
jgi:hypothetical protein